MTFPGIFSPSFYLSLVHLTSVDRFARTYAGTSFFLGIATSVATPAAGALFDVTDNYDLPYFATSFVALCGGIGMFVVGFYGKLRKKNVKERV